jgi:hypothetical protein
MENTKSLLFYSLIILCSPCNGSESKHSLSEQASKYIDIRLCIPRPHCPIDGKSFTPPNRGVIFYGKIFYFSSLQKENEVRKALADPKDLKTDVAENLALTREDFDAARIEQEATSLTDTWDIWKYSLIIGGNQIELCPCEITFIFYMLARHFGLSKEELDQRLAPLNQ